jgi:activating signal cointegrator complex subunit 1
MVDPRRLHLTLGVMALDNETKNIADALKLLESLRPELGAILKEGKKSVKVQFKTAPEVLKTEKHGDEMFANVLYLGVREPSDETIQLKQVCGTPGGRVAGEKLCLTLR